MGRECAGLLSVWLHCVPAARRGRGWLFGVEGREEGGGGGVVNVKARNVDTMHDAVEYSTG